MLSNSPSRKAKFHDHYDDALGKNVEFDEVDIDDELDPAMREEIDRFGCLCSFVFL